MRIIALDVGDRMVGVAVSDPDGLIAQPYASLKRDQEIFERVSDIAKGLKAEKIIVGMPMKMDGTEGLEAIKVREFAAELEKKTGIPVDFVDERLSTKEAERTMKEMKAPLYRAKEMSHSIAASLFLRKYLESGEGNA